MHAHINTPAYAQIADAITRQLRRRRALELFQPAHLGIDNFCTRIASCIPLQKLLIQCNEAVSPAICTMSLGVKTCMDVNPVNFETLCKRNQNTQMDTVSAIMPTLQTGLRFSLQHDENCRNLRKNVLTI